MAYLSDLRARAVSVTLHRVRDLDPWIAARMTIVGQCGAYCGRQFMDRDDACATVTVPYAEGGPTYTVTVCEHCARALA